MTFHIDGKQTRVPEGSNLLAACGAAGVEVPTLCYAENLTPVNVCRICVVELEGARTLVPSRSRRAEAGMVVQTDSERVRTSRKLVLELLGSSVDMSRSEVFNRWSQVSDADPARFGPAGLPDPLREAHACGHHQPSDGARAANVAQPVKTDNDLFVRDYGRCMLCYKCVEACGSDAQNTFAIAIAGRGFDARVAVEFDASLPDSACVYCGNCVGVCPTGALSFKKEHDLRALGQWDESRQTVTDTICHYCGVGCTLTLRVQDNEIVRVTSPADSSVTGGHLCVKGRFGFSFVSERAETAERDL